jgi:CheY-like chemotaxis protein
MKESADPRVEISCSICASLWDVPADTGQIRQVIINLCMNAIDSLPNGGHVMLKTENVTVGRSQHGIPPDREPGHYVSITVEDDGIGMDPSVRERIFEPFFTTKSKAGSQGLGLAMAYGSVTKHGGWITCESEPDQGSRFSIYLLRTEQRSEPMIVEHQTAEGRNTEPCILVVDDEAGVRRIAVSVLKRSSFKTMEACDGDEAIKIFREQGASIDAVLLDLSMPKVSGRETFIALKKMNQNIPVLLCSGYPVGLDEFEEETGHRAEAVIQKPFNVAELGKTVHGVLHRSLADAVA